MSNNTIKETDVQVLKEEIACVKKRQKRMEYILRWIVLIPTVFIVGKLAIVFASFIYEHFWVHNSYMDISQDVPEWFIFYFRMCLLEGVSVVATLFSACYIAPTHKKWVFGIYTIWLIFSAYATVHWGNTEYNFTLFRSIVSYVVITLGLFSAIGICYSQLNESQFRK